MVRHHPLLPPNRVLLMQAALLQEAALVSGLMVTKFILVGTAAQVEVEVLSKGQHDIVALVVMALY